MRPTLLTLGPADHGRALTPEEYESAQFREEGARYELIDGRLYVAAMPNPPHDRVLRWLDWLLSGYAHNNPSAVNYISTHCEVEVPGRPDATRPQPDLAAYRDYPVDLPFDAVRWPEVSPVLVVEIVSADDPNKDFVRNVELYRQVPSIREYWIFDPRQGAERPTLFVHRRRGRGWRAVIEVAPGETYTTRLLPGLTLVVDPRR